MLRTGNDSHLAHTELLGFSWRDEGGVVLHPGQSQHPLPELPNVLWSWFGVVGGLEGHWALFPGGSCTVSLNIDCGRPWEMCPTATTAACIGLR